MRSAMGMALLVAASHGAVLLYWLRLSLFQVCAVLVRAHSSTLLASRLLVHWCSLRLLHAVWRGLPNAGDAVEVGDDLAACTDQRLAGVAAGVAGAERAGRGDALPGPTSSPRITAPQVNLTSSSLMRLPPAGSERATRF